MRSNKYPAGLFYAMTLPDCFISTLRPLLWVFFKAGWSSVLPLKLGITAICGLLGNIEGGGLDLVTMTGKYPLAFFVRSSPAQMPVPL